MHFRPELILSNLNMLRKIQATYNGKLVKAKTQKLSRLYEKFISISQNFFFLSALQLFVPKQAKVQLWDNPIMPIKLSHRFYTRISRALCLR